MNIYFAEKTKKLRLEKELTQERLADILCVSPRQFPAGNVEQPHRISPFCL